MEKVLDPILKNLPSQMSLSHWRVGPIQGDFQVKNDLRAAELQATTDYGLMEMDDQVAVATAAAAAAMAIEHEHQNRPRYYRMGHVSNHERLRAFAATLPQQRERMGEVLQELRLKAPEMIQEIRQRTPEVIRGIQQRTPIMIKGIQQRTPEVIQGIKEYVREHVLQRDELPPQEECDAAGRKISNSSYYNNSLNEEEQREQPPCSSYQGMQRHCNEAWKKLYQPNQEPSEFYVNFEDGNAQDAINQATYGAPASKVVHVDSGYANMNDPLDVSARHPPMKLDPAEQPTRGEKQTLHSKPRHVWGTKPYEEECKISACEEPVVEDNEEVPQEKSEEQEMGESNKQSVCSTAKYHWGPAETELSPSKETAPGCSHPQKKKPELFDLSGNDDPTDDDTSSSENEDLLIDQSSLEEREDNTKVPPQEDLVEPPQSCEVKQPQLPKDQPHEDLLFLAVDDVEKPNPVQQDMKTSSGPICEDFDA